MTYYHHYHYHHTSSSSHRQLVYYTAAAGDAAAKVLIPLDQQQQQRPRPAVDPVCLTHTSPSPSPPACPSFDNTFRVLMTSIIGPSKSSYSHSIVPAPIVRNHLTSSTTTTPLQWTRGGHHFTPATTAPPNYFNQHIPIGQGNHRSIQQKTYPTVGPTVAQKRMRRRICSKTDLTLVMNDAIER